MNVKWTKDKGKYTPSVNGDISELNNQTQQFFRKAVQKKLFKKICI